MFDLISIGDSVVDTNIPLIDAQTIEIHGQKMIALPLGAKVPVEEGASFVGGNAANNAVASARLGLKTAIYSHVGNKDDDQDDDRIIAKLKREKVDLRYVVSTDSLPSNHHIILNHKGERTILTHHQPWKFNLPDLDQTKWVYLTSMSPSYVESNVMDQIINFLERTGSKLAYQPGTFQIMQGLKKNTQLLLLSEVLILNKEESKLLLGLEKEDKISIKKLLESLKDLGANKVIITDGIKGSFGFDGQSFLQLDIFPAKLLEMTGAGDAYASGVVAALIKGEDFSQSMRWGAANSASVVEQSGPQSGLLTSHQMQERLKENKNIKPSEF